MASGSAKEVGPLQDCRMLDLPELMKFLNVSKTTVYSFIGRKSNPIPSVKMGKVRRFPLDKVRWWAENLGQ